MNKIKNSYRVEADNIDDIIEIFQNLITKSINDNKMNGVKKLVTISIRVSFNSPISNKKVYVTLFTKNIDINSFRVNEIITDIIHKLNNRSITPETISSLHIHLYYL